MREYALKCVWEKTTPLSGKNNTYPGVVIVWPVKGEERRSPGVAEPLLDARAVAAMAS
jgi:hypothetical protein